MPDRLRLVNGIWPKRPTLVLDIAAGTITPVRGTFKLVAGKKTLQSSPQPGREGGTRVVGERLDNAQITVTLAVLGATQDNALTIASSLLAALEANTTPGQYIEWRPDGASRSTYWEIRGTPDFDPQYSWAAFSGAKLFTFNVAFTVAPRGVMDSRDVVDSLEVDTIATGDWSVDSGTGISILGRQFVVTDTTIRRVRHIGTGLTDVDVQAQLRITTGSAVANLDDTVMINADTAAADTHLGARIAGSGSGTSPNTLAVVKRIAGTLTVLASTALTPAAGVAYDVRCRREGNIVYADVFTSTTATPMATPTVSVSYTLTVSEAAFFAGGQNGFRVSPGQAGERYSLWRAEPYTYRAVSSPDTVQLLGAIQGDAPARADLVITTSGAGTGSGSGTGAGGQQYPVWAAAGWNTKPLTHNECWNGDQATDSHGWTNAAVSGVIGASTSVARDTTLARAKYGGANLLITCPATTDTGGSFYFAQRAKKGRRYLAMFWASAASATTAVRAKLGVSGDLATGTAAALTTTPTLFTVVWTPTADRDGFYVAAGINAATATAWNISSVVVCELATTDLSAAIVSTSAPTLSVTSQPPRAPAAPFYALIDSELVYVRDTTSLVWASVDRGAEGTTAATHLVNAAVYVLPAFVTHLQGAGAQTPVGVIEAESCDASAAGSFAVVTDSNYRAGGGVRTTTSGVGTGICEITVDPHLLLPDDFSLGDIDIQVYARVELAVGVVSPTIIGTFRPLGGALAYSERVAAEPNIATGKTLKGPSSGTAFRYVFLGTYTLPVDVANPQRWIWRASAAWAVGSTGSFGVDYFTFLPRLANMRGPERVSLAGYPLFVTGTAEQQRTLRADGRALAAFPPGVPSAYHALGGKLLRLDPGQNDLTVQLCSMVPDDQTAGLTDSMYQAHSSTIHVAVQPGVLVARAS